MNTVSIVSIIEFVLALGVIILLHELGHFIFGRLNKIEVEEFGIGYPPRLLKLFTWQGTLFTLNLIPFGGFCRFKGDNNLSSSGGLASANKWARLSTLLGGPLMNLLLAILLFGIVISQVGIPQTSVVEIKQVSLASPAAAAGLMASDVILEANGQKIDAVEKVINITQQNLDKEMSLLISRNAQKLTITITPRANPPEGQGPMGVLLGYPTQPVNFFQSIPLGLQTTLQMGKQLIMLPIMILRGQVDSSQVRLLSPKGVYDIYSQVRSAEMQSPGHDTRTGLLNFLSFFAVISAALGFSNLLPIPALDGGHILFLLPEIILNKKIPAKFENTIQIIGLTLLLALMAFVFIQDFINPVVLPK